MRFHFHDRDIKTGKTLSGVTIDGTFIMSTVGERCNVTVADEVYFDDKH